MTETDPQRHIRMSLSRTEFSGGFVHFEKDNDDPDDEYPMDELMLSRSVWEAMHLPRSIDIVVSPVAGCGVVGDGNGDDRGWTR